MTCDICGHPESSHVNQLVHSYPREVHRPCSCGQCPGYEPFQGYFGPPPIEQESA